VTGQFSRFEGNYTLKIIGGKYREQDDIQMFSEEEVVRYNKLGRYLLGGIMSYLFCILDHS